MDLIIEEMRVRQICAMFLLYFERYRGRQNFSSIDGKNGNHFRLWASSCNEVPPEHMLMKISNIELSCSEKMLRGCELG